MDEQAFIRENAQDVYNLSLRLVQNPSDAEDLAQDSLLRALKSLPNFRGESSVSTWLYRITVNTWKNRVRAEKRRGFFRFVSLDLFFGEDGSAEEKLPSNEPPLDQNLAAQEKKDAVRAALARMPEEARAVIVLRDLEERSYQDISQILGVPEGTVKSRLSRARLGLKDILKKSF